MKAYIKKGLKKATNADLVKELIKRVLDEKKYLLEHSQFKKSRLEQAKDDIEQQLDQLEDIQTDLECL